ncbi:hypothetical protein [Tessaracoccus oleiagri]|uniref:hypothetical protein n=1 Tax=Tessaracoccus oleiagri TaxID=686624 RepID=UPI0015A4E011|nr:hypothetical protein [Tessaracoccus oleiagri]
MRGTNPSGRGLGIAIVLAAMSLVAAIGAGAVAPDEALTLPAAPLPAQAPSSQPGG